MTTRRTFMISGAGSALALTAPAVLAGFAAKPPGQIRARGSFILSIARSTPFLTRTMSLTDAPMGPLPIVRREVIDEAFGADVYDSLDHQTTGG